MSAKAAGTVVMYGLKSCDTCRKAQAWLRQQGVDFDYRDVRADGLEADRLAQWLASDYAAQLINRRSTTWRQLTEAEKNRAETGPVSLLQEHPSLLKRPVLLRGPKLLAVGFKPAEWQTALAH